MAKTPVDFAVFGASPLALLLAGLLAHHHGRTVALIAETESRYRLPRAIDVSVAPITRPEHWALLTKAVPETRGLLAGIGGRRAMRRLDPVVFAETTTGQEALGHVGHMARGHGFLVDRVTMAKRDRARQAIRIGDALALDRHALLAPLEKWLTDAGIVRFHPEHATITPEGGVDIRTADTETRASRTILVDDAAILRHLPEASRPDVLQHIPNASILTSTQNRLAGDVMMDLDTGTTLLQAERQSVAAWGPGNLARFSSRLAPLLDQQGVRQQIGQSGYDALASADGAPIIGSVGESAPIILTGLGSTGAFLAPVLARWLANQAPADEADWCASHRPAPLAERLAIADFVALQKEPMR